MVFAVFKLAAHERDPTNSLTTIIRECHEEENIVCLCILPHTVWMHVYAVTLERLWEIRKPAHTRVTFAYRAAGWLRPSTVRPVPGCASVCMYVWMMTKLFP